MSVPTGKPRPPGPDKALGPLLRSLADPKSDTLNVLIDIRKRVEWPRDKDSIMRMRTKQAVILDQLKSHKRRVVDVALSILGNCCMEKSCGLALGALPLLAHLKGVFHRFPHEDSINGRAFRLIGNICQHNDLYPSTILDKRPQIVEYLVKFLHDSAIMENGGSAARGVSDATVTMAIRVVRLLLSGRTIRTLVKEYKVLTSIGMVLIKFASRWELSKSEPQPVLMYIIKLLLQYSKYEYYQSVLTLKKTPNGDSLAYLVKILLLSPRDVVKIVTNFLRITQLKSELPIPEIFNIFVDILGDSSDLAREYKGSRPECLKCLCLLFDHPSNRANDRCGDSIPILIRTLKDLSAESREAVRIISTLNKCKYNEELIVAQIKLGIFDILVDKLRAVCGSLQNLHIPHKLDFKFARRRFLRIPSDRKKPRLILNEEDQYDDISTSDSDDEQGRRFDRRDDWSPASSSRSGRSGLSPRSTCSPPYRFVNDDSDSDNYSPVCSEDEEMRSQIDQDDVTMDNDDFDDDIDRDETAIDFTCLSSIKVELIVEIHDLVKTYLNVKPVSPELGKQDFLLALVKSCLYLHYLEISLHISSDLVSTICRILQFNELLLPILLTDFIPRVYMLRERQHKDCYCAKCDHYKSSSQEILKSLSQMAQADVGCGDIAHQLLRGSKSTQQKLLLVIPYVVRKKSLLRYLLIQCKGLDMTIEMLVQRPEWRGHVLKALSVLGAKNLGITNPRRTVMLTKTLRTVLDNTNSPTYDHSIAQAPVVTFKMDDGSSVQANPAMLCSISDFFRCLLRGEFREAGQSEVHLHEVKSEPFRYLVDRWLPLAVNKSDFFIPPDVESVDLTMLLETIALCDRFLMPFLCAYLTDQVGRFCMGPRTVPRIYRWSMESQTNLLRVECVAYALVGHVAIADRVKMFEELFEMGYQEDLITDTDFLLRRYFGGDVETNETRF